MKVWVVTWIEDVGEFRVFSSKKLAWNYICEYYKRVAEFGNEDYNELKKSYEEGGDCFCNEYIIAVEKTVDEKN